MDVNFLYLVWMHLKLWHWLIDWLIILFQLSNILSTNTIFDGRAIYTPLKHHSYIGKIYIFTYNTIKINKNVKTYKKKKHFKIEFWSSYNLYNAFLNLGRVVQFWMLDGKSFHSLWSDTVKLRW